LHHSFCDVLIDIFNHAAAKGLCSDIPAASTINRSEKKQRKRHTVEDQGKGASLATERDRFCAGTKKPIYLIGLSV
jgi:hypothetical protein